MHNLCQCTKTVMSTRILRGAVAGAEEDAAADSGGAEAAVAEVGADLGVVAATVAVADMVEAVATTMVVPGVDIVEAVAVGVALAVTATGIATAGVETEVRHEKETVAMMAAVVVDTGTVEAAAVTAEAADMVDTDGRCSRTVRDPCPVDSRRSQHKHGLTDALTQADRDTCVDWCACAM